MLGNSGKIQGGPGSLGQPRNDTQANLTVYMLAQVMSSSSGHIERASAYNSSAAWAAPFRAVFDGAPKPTRPLRVLSPCAGLDAPQRAAKEMGLAWESMGDFDTAMHVKASLELLAGGDSSKLFISKTRGDVLNVEVCSLPKDTDAVISGHPCPPFSSIGGRMAEMDSRSCVFVCVCTWISWLSTHGCLKFFILENVSGILSKRKGHAQSFSDWILAGLRDMLPQGWTVSVVTHNDADCLLPQNRSRVFMKGVGPELQSTRRLRHLCSQPPRSFPRVNLIDYLDLALSDDDWFQLTLRQQLNVTFHLDEFENKCKADSNEDSARKVAIIDAARDPLRKFESKLVTGKTSTLRTNSSHLWLIPSPGTQHLLGRRGRFLSSAEKCRCAGILPSSVISMTPLQIDTAIGNCIPVPLIGTVLFPVVRAWAEFEASRDAAPTGKGASDGSADQHPTGRRRYSCKMEPRS